MKLHKKEVKSDGKVLPRSKGVFYILSKLLTFSVRFLLNACASEPQHSGGVVDKRPAHHTDKGFRNLYGSGQQHKGLWPYLKMRYIDEDFPEPDQSAAPRQATVDFAKLRTPSAQLQATWIGHASVLLQIGGKNILTDPVFESHASPVKGFGPRRFAAPGLLLDQLPKIDFVVISHNHYDHLEESTVRRIGDSAHWLVPLGLKRWFADCGVTRVTELDWWQEAHIDDVLFIFTPAQHWSRRGIADTNKTPWGSWSIARGGRKVWFAGDTGYAKPVFREIGKRLGPFDLALIPIGGYAPHWFMGEKHVDPDDAVRIHRDVRARRSIGIHWGTFVMTSEPLREPAVLLTKAKTEQKVAKDAFVTLARGETLEI